MHWNLAGTVRAVLVSDGRFEFVADFELGDRQAIFSGLHVEAAVRTQPDARLRNLIDEQ